MKQLSKTIQSFKNGGTYQDIQIDVEYISGEVDVIDVKAFNFVNNKLSSCVSIQTFLESQNLLDPLIDSIDWNEIACEKEVEGIFGDIEKILHPINIYA